MNGIVRRVEGQVEEEWIGVTGVIGDKLRRFVAQRVIQDSPQGRIVWNSVEGRLRWPSGVDDSVPVHRRRRGIVEVFPRACQEGERLIESLLLWPILNGVAEVPLANDAGRVA